MLAEDVKPNRLERAKLGILDILKKLSGNQVGLIAFAGEAFLQCPLTLDYDAFQQTLESIDTDTIARGGTDIASAIRVAAKALRNDKNHKILVLITDGEDLEESGIKEAQRAAGEGITIYTVGIGTKQGELIPIRTKSGGTDYLRDSAGKLVKTTLDESTLRKIAEETNGFYVPFGIGGEGLEQVYEAGLALIPEQDLASKMERVAIDRFQWPLGLAIYCLMLEAIMGTRKRNFFKRKSIAPAAVVVLLLFVLFPKHLEASAYEAYKAYEEKDYAKSSQLYADALHKDKENALLSYNLGTSLYREGEYEKANKAFEDALHTDNTELQKRAFFNMGDAKYRQGERLLKDKQEETVKLWEESLKDYENVMGLDKEHSQAKENYEFVKRKLDELKKKIEQEKQQQQQKQDQQNKEDKKNKDDSQNQQQQSDQQKDQEDKQDQNKDNQSDQQRDEDQKQSDQKDEKPGDQQQPQEQKPEEKEGEGKPEESQRDKEEGQENESEQLSRDEARQLLNALRDSEKKLPTSNESGNTFQSTNSQYKDW